MSNEYGRLAYPDFIKLFAIALVTAGHCAQSIQGAVWTEFLFGNQLHIAFHMPLFMIMSGWFIDFDKMRKMPLRNSMVKKTKRLLLPSISWYLMYCLCTLRLPNLDGISFFWYLTALWICSILILLISKVIRNDIICFLVSILIVLLLPGFDFSHVNFMMPFLFVGFYLRKKLQFVNKWWIVSVCILLSITASYYWHRDYSVYLAPLVWNEMNFYTINVYLYRFFIGCSFSIGLVIMFVKIDSCTLIRRYSHYGQYTLCVYTSSFILNFYLERALKYIHFSVRSPLLINVLAWIFSVIFICLAVWLTQMLRRSKYAKLMLLGEE